MTQQSPDLADLSQHLPRENSRYIALIPAAGVGTRMASNIPKQYLDLAGENCIAAHRRLFFGV